MQTIMLLCLGLLTLLAAPARTAAAADLALVLLTDVSSSMDAADYQLVKSGYQAAFSDPQVIAALLDNPGGVAVAYVEFSDADQIALVKGWDLLTDAGSARAFGAAVAAAPRSSAGNTALAAGIRQASRMLLEGDFADARLVIDVASDHESDGGRSAGVRDAAVAAGITINALPIFSSQQVGTFDGHLSYSSVEWGLGGRSEFYRLNVIGGPGSFLIEARNYNAFGEALMRKLLRELIAGKDGHKSTLVPLVTADAAP
jgi:hypothetical protein